MGKEGCVFRLCCANYTNDPSLMQAFEFYEFTVRRGAGQLP